MKVSPRFSSARFTASPFRFWLSIALGFTVAFLAALLVVRTVVGFVARHGFAPFAWYRIALGTLALVVLSLG